MWARPIGRAGPPGWDWRPAWNDWTGRSLARSPPDGALQSAFTETEIRDACATVHRRLAQVQLAHLPEGEYDLGGIILDELLGFRRADMTDQLKLHRLV